MSMVGTKGTWVAALLLSASLLGGSGVMAGAAPRAQSAPAAQADTAADQCHADEANENDENGAGDQDNVQNENGADDAAEGDTNGGDEAEDKNGENGSEDESAAAKPGELSEGKDLLPKATISVEKAIEIAQGTATGQLGSVELDEQDGALVFSVTVGDREVAVDAGDGSVLRAEPTEKQGGDCENATDAQSGAPTAG